MHYRDYLFPEQFRDALEQVPVTLDTVKAVVEKMCDPSDKKATLRHLGGILQNLEDRGAPQSIIESERKRIMGEATAPINANDFEETVEYEMLASSIELLRGKLGDDPPLKEILQVLHHCRSEIIESTILDREQIYAKLAHYLAGSFTFNDIPDAMLHELGESELIRCTAASILEDDDFLLAQGGHKELRQFDCDEQDPEQRFQLAINQQSHNLQNNYEETLDFLLGTVRKRIAISLEQIFLTPSHTTPPSSSAPPQS